MAKRLAVLGAGPIGIEAATAARSRGWDVTVFEAGDVGHHLRLWAHVRLFSPWSLNCSSWGRAALAFEPDEAAFPTAQEYLDTYLRPLAQTLGDNVETHTRVLGVSRQGALKGEFIGKRPGNTGAFLVHVESDGTERYVEADAVFDTTGVYELPAMLGPGGLPAIGERANASAIERYIPDVLGNQRDEYAGRRVLVVGSGYSAVTSLRLLAQLRQEALGTQIFWAFRGTQAPYSVMEDDPLPERKSLSAFGNAAARGEVDGVMTVGDSTVEAISKQGDGLHVTFRREDGPHTLVVDRLVANIGYRPDVSLTRELQVHHCWASEGPMKLAASLLAASGSGADCLTQTSAGVDVLRNPEPGFFVLGAKSYGRNSSFLLRLGFEQISEVLDALA